MYLPNTNSQAGLHRSFRGDGVIASSLLPQLVLPQALSRTMLTIVNTGASVLWMDHGCARASAVLTADKVTSCTIQNAGFGFTYAPLVSFVGGGNDVVANSAWNGKGLIGSDGPAGVNLSTTPPTYFQPAIAHAVLTTGAVTSIVMDFGGAGYVNPPEVILTNDPRDPFGCADPSLNSGSGVLLPISGAGVYKLNGTACWTDALAVFGTADAKFYVDYMP